MNNEFNISKNSAFTKIIKKDKLDICDNYTDRLWIGINMIQTKVTILLNLSKTQCCYHEIQ